MVMRFSLAPGRIEDTAVPDLLPRIVDPNGEHHTAASGFADVSPVLVPRPDKTSREATRVEIFPGRSMGVLFYGGILGLDLFYHFREKIEGLRPCSALVLSIAIDTERSLAVGPGFSLAAFRTGKVLQGAFEKRG